MTNTSLVSHSLPLGETHAQAAVRAEVWVWERIEVRAVLQHVLSICRNFAFSPSDFLHTVEMARGRLSFRRQDACLPHRRDACAPATRSAGRRRDRFL